MSSKAALKAAKSALDAQNFDEAITASRGILEDDPKNYFANVFLGRALEKKGNTDEAIGAYEAATRIKPQDELSWKGLCNVLESLGSKGVARYTSAALELAKIYAEQDDAHQCQTMIDKIVAFAKENGSRKEYQDALRVMLPSSPVFEFLEGRIQSPSHTYIRLAEIAEAEEKETINREIGERRTRLGAKIDQVKANVQREAFAKGEIEQIYRDVIDWTADDELRREYEEKYLDRAYTHLTVLAAEDKAEKREEVLKLAHDMVLIKHPFKLAWQIELDWRDFENISELDKNVLREYFDFFPDSGISKILTAYFGFRRKQVANGEVKEEGSEHKEGVEEKEEEEVEAEPLDSEEKLILMADGLETSKKSPFAHRLVSDYYLQIQEYESCVDVSRKTLSLLFTESKKSGLKFQNNNDGVCLNLGTSLVYYQSPKNHPEAQNLFSGVLERKPNATAALLGIGLIYEEQEDYQKAESFLSRALARDPENNRIAVEAAWCKALNGDLEGGLQSLQECLDQLSQIRFPPRDLLSQTQYRIGKCMWELQTDKASRKSRKGAYANFLSAIKADPNFAPPYTLLGIYYADYARDTKRARQCFQKAFELSAQEVVAAHRLAQSFAGDGDWDIVEIIAQRVIESGVVKPAPGSKKKGLSWPLSAMGIVLMNKQEFPKAVISFQAALRISPREYNSWVGLGESYHSSGRYNAARRTLEHALEIFDGEGTSNPSEKWFAQYMLANVHRELGEFEDAIRGYSQVLQSRPGEFGVSIAFIQTYVEQAWSYVETGSYGAAAASAKEAILVAQSIAIEQRDTFNFWKAVGDASAIFALVPFYLSNYPTDAVRPLLSAVSKEVESIAAYDKIELSSTIPKSQDESVAPDEETSLKLTVLSFKRALYISTTDVHAQAVAWFNLGWIEHRLYSSTRSVRYLHAAVRGFKKAIELEARNAEFWNALGVVTSTLNPKVAQHSFVRSLHLNERSARTWTNLGTLYLLQNDTELAHQAFGRAQSTDPDFAHAWIGEGLIALSIGDTKEALSHFQHASEISDASSPLVKSLYTMSVFDSLLASSTSKNSSDLSHLIQPLHALQQLQTQLPSRLAFKHLLALMQERVSDFTAACGNFQTICDALEQEYESTESEDVMLRFAISKADLARCQLASLDYNSAIENAETALDLCADPEDGQLSQKYDTAKVRLSAHLTLGLAHFRTDDLNASIESFRSALTESSTSQPAVIVLLSQVLYATQGDNERAVATEQLTNLLQNERSDYLDAALALGAMAGITGNKDHEHQVLTLISGLQTQDSVSSNQREEIEDLRNLLASLPVHTTTSSKSDSSSTPSTSTENESKIDPAQTASQSSTALYPSSPHAWTRLALLNADTHAADMAILTARHAVLGSDTFSAQVSGTSGSKDIEAQTLADAYTLSGRAGDAQRAIMLAPFSGKGWGALGDAVGSVS